MSHDTGHPASKSLSLVEIEAAAGFDTQLRNERFGRNAARNSS